MVIIPAPIPVYAIIAIFARRFSAFVSLKMDRSKLPAYVEDEQSGEGPVTDWLTVELGG